MPSSGLPMESLFAHEDPKSSQEDAVYVEEAAQHAMKAGMFCEWLECFVGAWKKTKDVRRAAQAGIIEWDL